jgi:hypothetical protein
MRRRFLKAFSSMSMYRRTSIGTVGQMFECSNNFVISFEVDAVPCDNMKLHVKTWSHVKINVTTCGCQISTCDTMKLPHERANPIFFFLHVKVSQMWKCYFTRQVKACYSPHVRKGGVNTRNLYWMHVNNWRQVCVLYIHRFKSLGQTLRQIWVWGFECLLK